MNHSHLTKKGKQFHCFLGDKNSGFRSSAAAPHSWQSLGMFGFPLGLPRHPKGMIRPQTHWFLGNMGILIHGKVSKRIPCRMGGTSSWSCSQKFMKFHVSDILWELHQEILVFHGASTFIPPHLQGFFIPLPDLPPFPSSPPNESVGKPEENK